VADSATIRFYWQVLDPIDKVKQYNALYNCNGNAWAVEYKNGHNRFMYKSVKRDVQYDYI